MTSETLKSCPFCGGEAFVNPGYEFRWCECRECGSEGPTEHTKAEAIAAWNARADNKRIAELEHQVATRDESIHNLTALLDKAHKERRELNARAERTCRIDSTLLIEGEYVPSPYYEYEMECGGGFCWDDSEPPTYCPNCGARVIGTEAGE